MPRPPAEHDSGAPRLDFSRRLSPRGLVLAVCAAQVLAQIGAYAWPALLPGFRDLWTLDNTAAGWITGLFYVAYMLSVPVLVTLTDRIDPRKVYLFGVGLTVVSHAGFALLADGFWTAAAARILAGVGWAGTYMTGLKLLADRVDDALLSRAVAGHAASIGVAGALSFAFAGGLADLFGWRAAFAAATICAALAWVIAFTLAPRQPAKPMPKPAAPQPATALLDFRPIFRNRAAMAYAVAYCVHTWEMNALRGWAVAFLAYVAVANGGATLIPATAVATAMALIGTGASVFGNELSIRFGRQRLIGFAMAASIACACVIGFVGPLSYALASGLVLFYGTVIWLDSASLTAGTAGSAVPSQRGATLAVHSMLGYAGGCVGPVAIGVILDLSGGMSTTGWGLAFVHVAAVVLAGRIAFSWLGPKPLAGDRGVQA